LIVDVSTPLPPRRARATRRALPFFIVKGFDLKAEDDFLDSRKALLVNKDCTIGLAAPQKSLRDYFYKNADADEMIFIHRKEITHYDGKYPFEYGDYLIIRGVIYQIDFDTAVNRLCMNHSRQFIRKTIQKRIRTTPRTCSILSVLFYQRSWRLMMKRAIFLSN
jgi:homogentisate 1,2-dioxygenase